MAQGRVEPDPGLVKAFRRLEIPQGPAVDFGGAYGRNAALMSKYRPTTMYELNGEFAECISAHMRQQGVRFEVRWENVLRLEFPPCSIAVIGCGITPFNPKSTVEEFLADYYRWLMPKGILHVEFMTYRDATRQSDFVQLGCVEEPNRKGSFVHFCGGWGGYCEHYALGITGGSFWDKSEADRLVRSLGQLRIFHREMTEWTQVIRWLDEESGYEGIFHETEELFRSFYQITAQKE